MRSAKIPTILATTALAVAVFGSTPLGQAAGRLIVPNSSVGAAQLKKNAVTCKKVKDGTLLAVDFKPGQLPAGAQGAKGEKGDKGDPGANGQPGQKGDKGDAGQGITGYVVTSDSVISVAPGASATVIAPCPSGKKVLSGGAAASNDSTFFHWLGTQGTDGYLAKARNLGAATSTLHVWAVCANVG
jgi:hypothetical protein